MYVQRRNLNEGSPSKEGFHGTHGTPSRSATGKATMRIIKGCVTTKNRVPVHHADSNTHEQLLHCFKHEALYKRVQLLLEVLRLRAQSVTHPITQINFIPSTASLRSSTERERCFSDGVGGEPVRPGPAWCVSVLYLIYYFNFIIVFLFIYYYCLFCLLFC